VKRPHGQFALQCGHDPGTAQIVDDDSIGDYGIADFDAWCYVCEAWVRATRLRQDTLVQPFAGKGRKHR
jgi:hypothetical protein